MRTEKIVLSLVALLVLLFSSTFASADQARIAGVTPWTQSDDGISVPWPCGPNAAATVLSFWDDHSYASSGPWPDLMAFGGGDPSNGNGYAALTVELESAIDQLCLIAWHSECMSDIRDGMQLITDTTRGYEFSYDVDAFPLWEWDLKPTVDDGRPLLYNVWNHPIYGDHSMVIVGYDDDGADDILRVYDNWDPWEKEVDWDAGSSHDTLEITPGGSEPTRGSQCDSCDGGNPCQAEHFCRQWSGTSITFCAQSCAFESCPSDSTCTAGLCIPDTSRQCYDGDAWYYDSCGNRISLAEECGAAPCNGGTCGGSCTPHHSLQCYDDDVYWYDSCQNREEKYEECGPGTCSAGVCVGGGSCSPDPGFQFCYDYTYDGVTAEIQADLESLNDIGYANGQWAFHSSFRTRIRCNGDLYRDSDYCDEWGCNGTYVGSNGIFTVTHATAYSPGVPRMEYTCFRDTGEVWVYVSAWFEWDYPVVHCYSDEHCGAGDYCDTAGATSTWQCRSCECSSGACCDGCLYRPASEVCQLDADAEYACIWGTDCGSDVAIRKRDRYCSGSSSSCDGAFGSWQPYELFRSCTEGQACDAGTASCVTPECCNAGDCDDQVFCNGTEACVSNSCVDGPDPDCSDGVGCTIDVCDGDSDSCAHIPMDGPCGNGLFCDGVEYCDPVLDCQLGSAPCTVNETCDEVADACQGVGYIIENITSEPGSDHSPAVSPDGQLIAFVSFRGGRVDGLGSPMGEIWVKNSDGTGSAEQVTIDSALLESQFHPVWCPSGTCIYFECDLQGSGGRNICRVPYPTTGSPWDTADWTRVTNLQNSSYWTLNDVAGDGCSLVFHSGVGPISRLGDLCEDPPPDDPPAYEVSSCTTESSSSQGRIDSTNTEIAYTGVVGGTRQVFTRSYPGCESPVQCTFDAEDKGIADIDGGQIVFDHAGNLFATDCNTTATLIFDSFQNANPAWFPNRTAIAFTSDRSGNLDVWTLIHMDTDGDGISEWDDNCPITPNGPALGTCTAGDAGELGTTCSSDIDCGSGGVCSLAQEDADGDGIGDACDIRCDDGLDNDGDGFVDTADPACSSGNPYIPDPTAPREQTQCQDGINNDLGQDPNPGLIDFDGGESIHGPCTGVACVAPATWPECGCPPGVSDPEGDGVANADPQCANRPWRNQEKKSSSYICGLGVELAFLLPLLFWWHRRRVCTAAR